jgi:hypothetical protein
MATKGFEMRECADDADWAAMLAAAPQATVFSSTAFLQSLGLPYKRYIFGPPGHAVALCCAAEGDGGNALVSPDYTPYQGILFPSDGARLTRQRVLDEFRATEYAIMALTERYRSVDMSLSWHVSDVRPFLWHHYHQPELGLFTITPRYTAVLDLDAIAEESFAAQARACRRQELRKAAAYVVREERNIAVFMELYAMTFARQGIELPPSNLALVARIAEHALSAGYGRLSSCVTPDGVAASNLFLFDHKRAYYLFGANQPDLRHSGASTRLMFENIAHAKRRGLSELDFVGVNSPNRADFKLSFNPELKLYFNLRFERPDYIKTPGSASP